MANLIWGFSGEALNIRWLAPDQSTGLFPQVRIVDSDGDVAETVNLSANSNVAYLYEGSWTPPSEGQFTAVIDIYTDSGRTTLDESILGTDMDIRVKDMGGAFRAAPLGGARVDRADMSLIIESIIEGVWKTKLNGRPAREVLLTRSGFDPVKEKVKVIPDELVKQIENRVGSKVDKSEDRIKRLLDTDGIAREIKGLDEDVQEKLGQVTREMEKINTGFAVLEDSGILELLSQFKNEVQSFQESAEFIVSEIQTNEKMLEALNEQEKQRFQELLMRIQALINALSNKVEKVNLSSVLKGFEMINDRLE